MVAVIRCPAKCKLGHITGTDYQAAAFVCNVHKNLSSFSRLRIFICDVIDIRIVFYIRKMLIYRRFDIYFFQSNTKRICKINRIVIRSVRCTETRHCYRDYILSVKIKTVKCTHGYQKCKCRVKSSAYTHNSRFGMCMVKSLFKSQRLN